MTAIAHTLATHLYEHERYDAQQIPPSPPF